MRWGIHYVDGIVTPNMVINDQLFKHFANKKWNILNMGISDALYIISYINISQYINSGHYKWFFSGWIISVLRQFSGLRWKNISNLFIRQTLYQKSLQVTESLTSVKQAWYMIFGKRYKATIYFKKSMF